MIWEAIKVQAKSNGGKTALICHDKKYTYSELVDSVEKLSAIISTAIKPGERVLFASKKEYHYLRMVLACDKLGVTFMPTMTELPEHVLDQIKSASKPDHVILNEEDALNLEPHNQGLLFKKNTSDLYTVIFTSGTTGEPKAVPHTRFACTQGSVQSIKIHSLVADDFVLSQLPPWTIGGLYLYVLPGLMKGCTVLMEMFNPRKFIEINKEYKPTIGIIVPAMMVALHKTRGWKELDLSHWRELGFGSTVCPNEMLQELFDKGAPALRNLFGCTETHVPMFTHLAVPDDPYPLQIHVTENYQFKLDRYNVCWIKGPLITKGYLNQETPIDNEGYWCTGDVLERQHNLLFYKSRKTDLFKVNSFNISPVSIENAFIPHPDVNEVCVTYRDRDLGEKEIVAIVSSDTEINTMELLKFAKDKLFQYEIPKEIIVTNDPLPRNRMGKVQRHVVREKFVETE